jgi:hypothetical protein
MRARLFVSFTLACAVPALAAGQPATRYAISIYNGASSNSDALFDPVENDGTAPGGYAVVRDRRQYDLKAGTQTLQVRDVPRWLDAAALGVRAVDAPDGLDIVSQRFEDAPLSLDALAQSHLGHTVEIVSGSGTANMTVTSGTLLANAGGLTLQLADGRVATVTEFTRVTFPDLPKGLAATPSLRWDVAAKKAGTQVFEIVYPTQGLGWRAEYSAWLAAGSECKLDFAAWAQIANRSGTAFADARLKLIAGEPHRVAAARARPMLAGKAIAVDTGNAGDYHEYTLDAPLDLGSGGLLRVALFPAQSIPCQRQYLFEASALRANAGMAPITERNYGSGEHQPVRSTLSLHVERALPAGRIRVIENAADGAAEFVGEDQLGHTPRGESVAVNLGDAFDLRGERSQSDYLVDKDKRTLSESFAIRVVNRSAHAQPISVREHLYRWTQWNIVQSSTKYEKRNADTVDFHVDVPANGEAKLSYTVQYQWSESLR